MMYKTKCGMKGLFKGCDGDLVVVSFEASTRIPLSEDGFSTEDAEFFDTTNERVECNKCGWGGPLEVIEEGSTNDAT